VTDQLLESHHSVEPKENPPKKLTNCIPSGNKETNLTGNDWGDGHPGRGGNRIVRGVRCASVSVCAAGWLGPELDWVLGVADRCDGVALQVRFAVDKVRSVSHRQKN
jgi:hypothetical protein